MTRLDDVLGAGDGLTLREALQAANTNQPVEGVSGELGHDTIVISPGLIGTLALTQGQLSIQETVTIHGLGESLTRIDAQQLSRVFDIEVRAGNVLLSDLSILNGLATVGENGGGIRSRSTGVVTLTHCTLSDNSVRGLDGQGGLDGADDLLGTNGGAAGALGTAGGNAAGGGIWSTGDLFISYSTISGNTAMGGIGGSGGQGGDGFEASDTAAGAGAAGGRGGTAAGGGIYAGGNLTLTASTISENSALGGNGGSGGHAGQSYTMVGYSTIGAAGGTGGDAGHGLGGGVYSAKELQIQDSTISGNTATGGIGGLAGYGGFDTQNKSLNGIPGVSGNAEGGGIRASGTASINQSQILNNRSMGGFGVTQDVPSNDSPAYYVDGLNGGSGGRAEGGGIWTFLTMEINESLLTGNESFGGKGGKGEWTSSYYTTGVGADGGRASGGAVHSLGRLELRNSELFHNKVTGGRGGDGASATNLGPYDSGSGSDAGDGGDANGGAIHANFSLLISMCDIYENFSLGGESGTGGYGFYTPTGVMDIGYGLLGLAGDPGDAYGGALKCNGAVLIENSQIDSNKAIGGNGAFGDASSDGGSAWGGGIWSSGEFRFNTSRCLNNSAIGGNGENSQWDTFGRNAGHGGVSVGGGMYLSAAAEIRSSFIESNTAYGGNGGDAADVSASFGPSFGGVAGNGGNAVGGGVYSLYDLKIMDSTLAKNQVFGGRAGKGSSVDVWNFGIATVGGIGGTATGGAIRSSLVLSISNSTISGNSARGGDGGAGGNLKLDSSGFSDGVTADGGSGGSGRGGGMYSTGDVFLVHSTIVQNLSLGGKGGIGGTGLTPESGGETGDNGASVSGGWYISPSGNHILNNSIIAVNQANVAPDLYGPVTTGGSNLIGIGAGITGLSNGILGNQIGSAALPLDPLLGPLADHGGATRTHALLPGSPALNAGDNALAVDPQNLPLLTDQRGTGFPRKAGNRVDIGAFESQSVNSRPTDLLLSGHSVPSATPGALVGQLQGVDPDPGTTFAYSLFRGGDNDQFVIEGNQLKVGPVGLNFYANPSHTRTVMIRVTDLQGGLTFYKRFTINLFNINHAPVLNPQGEPTLNPIRVNVSNSENLGNLVAEIIARMAPKGGITDPDIAPVKGIAVVGLVGSENGTWQFSLNNGVSWTNIATTGSINARLLAADDKTRIRYVPKWNFSGDAKFAFVAWDQTNGANGALINAGNRGGTTSYSLDWEYVSIRVNSAPVLNAAGNPTLDAVSVNVSNVNNVGTLVSTILARMAPAGGITDPGIGVLRGMAVVGLVGTENGTWQFSLNNGVSWTNIAATGSINARLLAADDKTRIRYVPKFNFSGAAKFAFVAWDRTTGTNGGMVNAGNRGGTTPYSLDWEYASIRVNSAPVLNSSENPTFDPIPMNVVPANNPGTLVSSMISRMEPSGGITDIGTGILKGIAVVGMVGSENGIWQFSLNQGTTWTDVGATGSINARLLAADSKTRIRFIPNPDFTGEVKLAFVAWDQSSGLNGNLVNAGHRGGTTAFSQDWDYASLTVLESEV